jgi:hypothetical protein
VATFRPSQVGATRSARRPRRASSGPSPVGGDIVREAVPYALITGAVFLLGDGAGVAVLVVTAVRRNNDARR